MGQRHTEAMRSPMKEAQPEMTMSRTASAQREKTMADERTEAMIPRVPVPTIADVLRYRYHYGVNFGFLFVLGGTRSEMIPKNCPGRSELHAVRTWIEREGVAKTQLRFEQHWRDFINDEDLVWLKDVANCTTVRLPVGYYTLGPEYCVDTPFESVSSVYENAWTAVRSLVKRCLDHGLGVLIDFHALPGGANNHATSGSNTFKAGLWKSGEYQALAIKCLCFIARQAKDMEGVIGIQILNEPVVLPQRLLQFYDMVLAELRQIDATIPVYIAPGLNIAETHTWSRKKNSVRSKLANPIVIDLHWQWVLYEKDMDKTLEQIVGCAAKAFCYLDGADGHVANRGAGQMVFGEYNCIVKRTDYEPDQFKPFGTTQCSRIWTMAGGQFFWTYRQDRRYLFRTMVHCDFVFPPLFLTFTAKEVLKKLDIAGNQRGQRKEKATRAHRRSWRDILHCYESWRFEQGWDVGYKDASQFFSMRLNAGLKGADTIGMLDLWCLKRLRESGQRGLHAWMFEHGLRWGVADFTEAVLGGQPWSP